MAAVVKPRGLAAVPQLDPVEHHEKNEQDKEDAQERRPALARAILRERKRTSQSTTHSLGSTP
jgi:hypothetical protein